MSIDFTVQTPILLIPRSRTAPDYLQLDATSIEIKLSSLADHLSLDDASSLQISFHELGLSLQGTSEESIPHELLGGLGLHIEVQSGFSQIDGVAECSVSMDAPALAVKVATLVELPVLIHL